VHQHDPEGARVDEFTVVTPLTDIARTLLPKDDSSLPKIKIRSELPSSLDPEGGNFNVILSTHGISDVVANERILRLAHDILVQDLWQRVSPYGYWF
jgi:hypothetical protein